MFTQQNRSGLSTIVLLLVLTVGCGGLVGCQTGSYSKLENDVYNCVNKFSSKVPKGFTQHQMERKGTSQIYSYSDWADNFFSKDADIDSFPRGLKGRAVRYQRYVGAQSKLQAGCFDINVDDLKRCWDDNAYMGTLLKLKPNSLVGFEAARSLEQYDDPEWFILQKGADAVAYTREKKGASWIRHEAHDMQGLFTADEKQLQEGETVPPEQVQRYIDLAERFYKTYSLPKGEPD